MIEINDIINKKKQLVKDYDNSLRLSIEKNDDIDKIKELFDIRNNLIDELLTLEMIK